MSCKISKKLTENGENDEKLFFCPFFTIKSSFNKILSIETVLYIMQKMYLQKGKKIDVV